jgi:hypothetical protein
MYQRNDIKEGMTVRSVDGHKLGKVYAVGETEFHIEKGLFFPKDYAVRYAEISDLRNGEVILAHGKDSLLTSSDEVPYGSDSIATREGIGTSPVTRAAASAEFAAGERTGLPFGAHPEDLRTQDLGNQEIGPYNTEGARASPILTEEDRARSTTDIATSPVTTTGIGTSPVTTPEDRGVDVPIRRERTTRRDVTDRPAMSATSYEETTVVTPVSAEELEARRRTMTDEELENERRRVADARSDDLGGPRKIGIDPEDFSKRGF